MAFLTSLITNLLLAVARISPDVINNVFNDLIPGKTSIPLQNSIINPIFGYLFDETGCLCNLRFYSPELQPRYSEAERIYAADESNDPFTDCLAIMFPSLTGTLNHTHNVSIGLSNNFNKDRNDGIKFFAKLFITILNDADDFVYNNRNRKRSSIFNTLKKELLQESTVELFKEKDLKLSLIHAFIINILDTEEELKLYLSEILDNIDQDNIKLYNLSFDIVASIVCLNEAYNNFPYSDLHPPPSNVQIPVYNRKNDSFDDKTLFSDCAETLLLNLCNSLFYDNETKKYNIEHLNLPEDSLLFQFYKKNNKPFTCTLSIRKEWSRIVQDLEDLDIVESNDSKPNMISYVREAVRNELNTGIINMMSILVRICNLSANEIFADMNFNIVEQRLTLLLNKLKIPKSTLRISIKELISVQKSGRLEFMGEVNIRIDYEVSKDVAIVLVQQDEYHAELYFVFSRSAEKQVAECIKPISAMDTGVDFPLMLLKKYMALISKELPSEERNLVCNVFAVGPALSNNSKRNLLVKAFEVIHDKRTDEPRISDLMKQTVELVLESADLIDYGSLTIFKPFILYHHKYILGKKEEFNSCRNAAFVFGNEKLSDLWIEEIVAINPYELDVSGTSLNKAALTAFCKLADCIPGLVAFSCSNIFLAPDGIPKFIEFLKKMPGLQLLYLSSIKTQASIEITIAAAIKTLKALKVLNISGNNLEASDLSMILDCLPAPEELTHCNLSSNKILEVGNEFSIFLEALKRLKNLQLLNISSNNIGNSGLVRLMKCVQHVTQLDLSETGLILEYHEKFSSEFISGLKEFKNLKALLLAGNLINPLLQKQLELQYPSITLTV